MRKRFILAIGVLSVCVLLTASFASAATCKTSDRNCKVTVSLTEFTGDPTVLCLIGHPVVLVSVSVRCGGQEAGPFETKICGSTSTPYVFQALGYEHTLKPGLGADWEALLGGACDDLYYERF